MLTFFTLKRIMTFIPLKVHKKTLKHARRKQRTLNLQLSSTYSSNASKGGRKTLPSVFFRSGGRGVPPTSAKKKGEKNNFVIFFFGGGEVPPILLRNNSDKNRYFCP